ncbi:anti-sigma factor antagonist [Pararhodospirillum photometricum]|nr:anti-sigma factor antagonist [Pararhodospirillum photometricum]
MSLEIAAGFAGTTATLTLTGELDAGSAPAFKGEIEKLAGLGPTRLVLEVANLSFMASAGLRVLIFAKQKLGTGVDIYVVKPQPAIVDTLEKTGFHHSVFIVDQAPA